MRSIRDRIVALGLLIAAPAAAGAQVTGIPVRNAGVFTGIGIAGEVGFPNDAFGSGRAYAVTGQIGISRIGFTASLASYDPEGSGDKITSVGGTANLKVFGGPLIPLSVTLQGGLGYSSFDVVGGEAKNLHVPVGLGVALNIPNPALAIRPWIAPRLDINRMTGDLGDDTETDFGISAGVDFNLLGGLGFRASYDRVSTDGEDPSIFAVGAHYVFKVPGL